MASRHWWYFGGSVLLGILGIAASLMGVIDALAVLSGGVAASEEFILVTMIVEAAEWFVVAVVFGLLAVFLLFASIVSVLRNASIPRSDRLVSVVESLERRYPPLRELDVKEKVEPTAQDRKQNLKDQYVDGDISEEEFEREMEQVMDKET